ncbi:MAG: hypothetical protein WBN94_00245 [Methanothrix sp.]
MHRSVSGDRWKALAEGCRATRGSQGGAEAARRGGQWPWQRPRPSSTRPV